MSRSLRSEVFNREIVSFRSCVTCVRAGEAKQRAGVGRSESEAGVVGMNISSFFIRRRPTRNGARYLPGWL